VKSAGLFALGVLIGAWGSLCGIGGGIFAVPLFHFLYGMPMQAAVVNSLVLVAVMTTGGTLVELAQPGNALHWDVVLMLVATSWIGTQLGFRVAQRIDVRTLKLVFCLLLVAVAVEILLSSRDRSVHAGTALEWRASLVVLVATTGIAAGFLAPLLGIGGGLVAVPALLFVLPSMGYLGVRACSTAMSACNGWQSLWLYRKRDGLQLGTALCASAGALAGSWIGVRIAHLPGITFYAELIVALTLLLVAARFAWDLRASRYPGVA